MGVGAIPLVCTFSISKKLIGADLKVDNRFQRYAYHRELYKPLAPPTVQIIHSLYRVMIVSWISIYILDSREHLFIHQIHLYIIHTCKRMSTSILAATGQQSIDA